MSFLFYKSVHIIGIAFLLIALGGALGAAFNGVDPASNRARRWNAVTHGAALVVLLVSGFGMLAKLGGDGTQAWGGWAWAKIVIWLLMGASLTVASKRPGLARPLWFILPILVFVAGYIAIHKPF